MSSDPPHLDYLEDILIAMEKVAQFTAGLRGSHRAGERVMQSA